ncbi:hypothetical protein Tco_1090312 [Tanacetum coccineum]|uniref:Uncharacterized protein n=1 Tax=Tanacetum coccineum TaxID=301880 RepID=A0ABQ5I3T1_9ASTR
MFINFRYYFDDDDGLMICKYFLAYTQTEVRQFHDTLIQHMESVKKSIDERAKHKREYDNRMNERQMQSTKGKVDSSKALDASLVVSECSGTKSDKQDTSSSSGNYITHAADADIRLVDDKVPFAEVDRNTIPDSTNMVEFQISQRLNKLVDTDEGVIQKEGADAEKINIQQGNENLEISQIIEDAHVTLSTVAKKTEVPVTSSSHSSDLAAKFLNFSDIPHTDAEIVSPMDVHVHHEVPRKQTPTLLTVPISVITESSPIYSTVIP